MADFKKILMHLFQGILLVFGCIFLVQILFLAGFYGWRWWYGPSTGELAVLNSVHGYYKNHSDKTLAFYWSENSHTQTKTILEDVDFDSFRKVNHYFAMDKKNAYGAGIKIPGADLESFETIGGAPCLAKDKNHVYVAHSAAYGPWAGRTSIADPKTFVMTSEHTGKDEQFEYEGIECTGSKFPFSTDTATPNGWQEDEIEIERRPISSSKMY